MIEVKLTADLTRVNHLLAKLSGPELQAASANALNDGAFEARRVIQANINAAFDRPTPYVRRSIVVRKATPGQLKAIVEPAYQGGKGVDPQNILRAEIFGGERKAKRAERAFQRVGILQPGYAMVPGEACPLDAYGNIKGSFIVQMLSYFQAMGEQGYRANMTAKRKGKLAAKGVSEGGYKTIGGVEYFIAWGRLRGGRSSHLHYGIWARSGIHGVKVEPIIMFVRTPHYRQRLDFFDRPVQAARAAFDRRMRYHVRSISERARP